MKLKFEELEFKNHDNFLMVMKIVKRYCDEKQKNGRPRREPRWSDRNMALHIWRGFRNGSSGGEVELRRWYVDAKDQTNGTNDEQCLLHRNKPGAVTNLVEQ
ncbi:hypothetical protein Tco_0236567 [Tanacetum coccineum]